MSRCGACGQEAQHTGVLIPWNPAAPIQVEHTCQTWGCRDRLVPFLEPARHPAGVVRQRLIERGLMGVNQASPPPPAAERPRGARRIELPSPEEPWRQPPAAEPAVDWPHGNPYAQGHAVLTGESLTVQAPIPAAAFQPTQKPHADGDTPRCRTGWCGIQGHRGGA